MTEEKEYLMHYIGSGLYGTRRFVNEARRIGVQRAIQFNLLRHVKWGDTILLAEHKKYRNSDNIEVPTATIFGYFKVDSLSHSGLPDDVKQKLIENLDVIKIVDYKEPEQQERACGEYSVGGYISVADDIETIVKKIEEACKELNFKPNHFKYFLKGELRILNAPLILQNKNFNRGYQKVRIQELKLEESKPQKSMYFLYDYERRMYLKKEEADKIDRLATTEFIESTT